MNRSFIAASGAICIAFLHLVGGQTDTAVVTMQKKNHSMIKVSQPKSSKEKGPMTTDSYLPMGITEETPLDKIELVYGFYSSKTGAGRQEMTLLGDGTVTLFCSRSYNDPSPKTLKVKCDSGHVLRLLDLLEGMGFFGLPDEYQSGDHPRARRLLKLSMPGRQKVIAVDEPGNYAIEQCIGAIKMCAGLCIPEAINQRFFPNL